MSIVTVAMPVHNGAATIGTTIRSLLQQTCRDWELHVVDDGSTDATAAAIEAFADARIRLHRDGRRRGLAARLNQVIAACTTPYLARLDADDVAYPERLEHQVAWLEAHPRLDLLGTRALVFADDGRALGLYPFRATHAEICANPWSGFYLAHPTWMGRTSWFRQHRYRENLQKSQDQDLLLRTFRQSEFACLPEVLTGYRQERLSIGKLARSRWHFSRALARAAWQHGVPLQAVIAPTRQAAKGLAEFVALAGGFDRLARRHRALPLDADERSRWEQVWSSLHEGGVA